MEYNFPVTRTTHPKPRPADETKLGFAKYFTDHMFVMDYDEGQGWHDGRVVPHEPYMFTRQAKRKEILGSCSFWIRSRTSRMVVVSGLSIVNW